MDSRIALLASLPGVLGTCHFTRTSEPQCSLDNLPGTVDIKRIGMQMVLLFSMGDEDGFRQRTVTMKFERATVMGIRLDDGAMILLICDAQANSTLVLDSAMSLFGLS
jgi:hypothetical protein